MRTVIRLLHEGAENLTDGNIKALEALKLL